jgi:uncharacterized protein YbjT (DUF2867 family)
MPQYFFPASVVNSGAGRSMRVLVTGASGLTGSALVARLIEEGHAVVNRTGILQDAGRAAIRRDPRRACRRHGRPVRRLPTGRDPPGRADFGARHRPRDAERILAAALTARRQEPLPPQHDRLFYTWFAFGLPALAAMLAIFWLMASRPQIAALTL